MEIINNIPVWGTPVDEGAMRQISLCAKTADRAALMADHHQGYSVPIGGVLAYKDKISPSGVGFDIACGNCAMKLNLHYEDIKHRIPQIADDIWNRISFGIGQKNKTPAEDDLFDNDPAWGIKEVGILKEMARGQLGTVGSGNHYVDLFVDQQDNIWVGVHFGSRGLGHKIATHFLKAAGAKDEINAEPCLLDVKSDLGEQYLMAMNLAGRYAYSGREWVCETIAGMLTSEYPFEVVHNHHNFAWHEEHGGEKLWVIRKGATPAFPGQRGFIGGSMGDISVIIRGYGSRTDTPYDGARKNQELSLYSTVHGAGRVMSRTQAKGKFNRKTGQLIKAGEITRDMMHQWIGPMGVELRGAGVDESPHCYKRIEEVLKHHGDTIVIEHKLYPIIVCMAGENEIDPYKD